MKNSDYVLRLESPLSGETNSYSLFFIHHSSFNEPRHRIEYNNYNNIKNKHKKRL